MDISFNEIVEGLRADPVLSKADPVSLARLLIHVQKVNFEAGASIYKAGDNADTLYVLVSGEVQLLPPHRDGDDTSQAVRQVQVKSGFFGEESVTNMAAYATDAVAQTSVSTLPIDRAHLAELLLGNPDMQSHYHFSLHDKLNRANSKRQAKKSSEAVAKPTSWFQIAGWGLCILLPILTLMYGERLGLSINQKLFTAIFIATAIMWIFTLTDEYIPGLFALTATLMLGLAPVHIVLGGFSSDAFLMALSILGLGAVITSSGLSYRFLLILLRSLPNNQFSNGIGLMITGTLLTPTLPTINGRVGLVTPLFLNMVESLKFKSKGRAATRLAVAAFTSVTLLSAVFLSSKSVNFVVFSLLPLQTQDEFQWMHWLMAAAVVGLASIVFYLIAASIFFRNDEKSVLSKPQVFAQLDLLGPMSKREWAGMISLVVFVVGVATSSIHRISPPWLGMSILYGLLLFGFLKKTEFRSNIDWTFLVYLGTIVGIVGAFNYLGLDKLLASALPDIVSYMRTDFGLFILLLAALIFVIRLVVPISATIVILAAVFMPLASNYGVNPWIVGIVILTLGEMWFMPYQCSYYIQFANSLSKHGIYDEKQFLLFNLIMNVLKISALYASIPYWKMLGLL